MGTMIIRPLHVGNPAGWRLKITGGSEHYSLGSALLPPLTHHCTTFPGKCLKGILLGKLDLLLFLTKCEIWITRMCFGSETRLQVVPLL